jgi:hypothetical protein
MANPADVTSFFGRMSLSANDDGMTAKPRPTNECGDGG